MSMDSVDDLEAAEDLIAQLNAAVRDLVDATPQRRVNSYMPLRRAVEAGQAMAEAAAAYCRPTCGRNGEPHGWLDEAGTLHPFELEDCGCPCHSR